MGSGITPAHAGKSFAEIRYVLVEEDHPRPCGEKDRDADGYKPQSGSPPPMRGKAAIYRTAQAIGGITPAHAGKSVNSLHINRKVKDHPRPCGEKLRLM